jgi:RNA ligase
MNIHDLLDMELLAQHITDGYVSSKPHPTLPLRILNYTKSAQWDRVWDSVTLQTRGLIFNPLTEEIVARPFPKFFNHGEEEAPTFSPEDKVWAFDKMDGSLGIVYPSPNQPSGYAVATRGSFTSDQALWATIWMNADPARFPLDPYINFTPLVEIVYPDNRIVLNYGDYEGLIYLGHLYIESGTFHYLPFSWPGRHADAIHMGTFSEVLALPDRENAEGLVVFRSSDGARVKLKQEDYLTLHKVVSNLTPRSIFEVLSDPDRTWEDFLAALPEEFIDWANDTALGITTRYVHFYQEASRLADDLRIAQYHGNLSERRDIAAWLQKRTSQKWLHGFVWKWLDNRPYSAILWKQVELEMKEEAR